MPRFPARTRDSLVFSPAWRQSLGHKLQYSPGRFLLAGGSAHDLATTAGAYSDSADHDHAAPPSLVFPLQGRCRFHLRPIVVHPGVADRAARRPDREADLARAGVLYADSRRPERSAIHHHQDPHHDRQLRVADRPALVDARRSARHARRLVSSRLAPGRIAPVAQRSHGPDESHRPAPERPSSSPNWSVRFLVTAKGSMSVPASRDWPRFNCRRTPTW